MAWRLTKVHTNLSQDNLTHWLISTQVLYQDNSSEHPLAKLGASGQAPSGAQHWSGE